MYILLDEDRVREIIPDIDPVFPGVPIGDRYPAKFLARLLHVSDDTQVEQNWIYDAETGAFSEPPQPEPQEPSTEPEYLSTDELDAAYQEGVDSIG